jgi:hypothetical protein
MLTRNRSKGKMKAANGRCDETIPCTWRFRCDPVELMETAMKKFILTGAAAIGVAV